MLQAKIIGPITERLLRETGLKQGMRVLDLGCGAGDVVMLAADLVGPRDLSSVLTGALRRLTWPATESVAQVMTT